MKPILIATDYSPAARNAADYAAQLALATHSDLVVVHVWSLPVMSGESPVFPSTIEELEKVQLAAVQAEADRLSMKWRITVRGIQHVGFTTDEIAVAAKESDASILVMGMKQPGTAGRLLGSIAAVCVRHSKIPVLIIPENTDYHKAGIFLFATDLQTKNDWHELDALKELAKEFHAGIHVLNVVAEEEVANAESGKSGVRLDNRLKDYPHSWYFPVDGDIVHAIGETAEKVDADWIVTVPHRQSWFKDLFHSSVTKKLAFKTSRPLLALPERFVHLEE